MHVCADDVAGVDVDHHVGIEVGALDRPGELGDVPGLDLPRAGSHQFGDRPGRAAGQAAPLFDLRVRGKDTVDRGNRT